MAKIAVHMPNWIGDYILALSVVNRRAELKPDDQIVLVTPEHLVGLSRQLSSLESVSYRRKNRLDFADSVSQIQKYEFDRIYIVPHSFSSAWFAFRTKISDRHGIRGELRSCLLTKKLPQSIASRSSHITLEYSQLLETPFADPSVWKGRSIVGSTSSEFTDQIVLCPGAAYGPSKQWQGFGRLVELLPERRFVVLGDERDAAAGDQIVSHAPDRVRNVAGTTSLNDAVSIIAQASGVVSNDSGLMHVAGYLGVPLVGIFGSTTPLWTRPLGARCCLLQTEEDCSPCFRRTCRKGSYACLRGIEPATVAASMEQVLRNARV